MKKILISGAAGGLGVCLTREYLQRGWFVLGTDQARNAAVEEQQGQSPDVYRFLAADVTRDGDVERLGQWAREQTDSLDVILNAVGYFRPGSDMPLEEFDITASLQTIDINALGPLRIAKACLPLLKKGERKVLLNVSSEAGSITTNCNYTTRFDYCMSKTALNMESMILQRYLKPDGIKVLLVHPGWIQTSMGGKNAPIPPSVSARGIADLADRYAHDLDAYPFYDYNGTPRPW